MSSASKLCSSHSFSALHFLPSGRDVSVTNATLAFSTMVKELYLHHLKLAHLTVMRDEFART
jgi:hypothetical protein